MDVGDHRCASTMSIPLIRNYRTFFSAGRRCVAEQPSTPPGWSFLASKRAPDHKNRHASRHEVGCIGCGTSTWTVGSLAARRDASEGARARTAFRHASAAAGPAHRARRWERPPIGRVNFTKDRVVDTRAPGPRRTLPDVPARAHRHDAAEHVLAVRTFGGRSGVPALSAAAGPRMPRLRATRGGWGGAASVSALARRNAHGSRTSRSVRARPAVENRAK